MAESGVIKRFGREMQRANGKAAVCPVTYRGKILQPVRIWLPIGGYKLGSELKKQRTINRLFRMSAVHNR